MTGWLTVLMLCQFSAASGVRTEAQQAEVQTNHAARIKALSEQLRWHDGEEREHYEAVKDDIRRSLFSELDAYISETFSASATATQVKASLDAVLGREKGDSVRNIVFSSVLPSGHFLIVGIELWQGGPAISENTVSFRAFKESENKLVYVVSIDALARAHGDAGSQPLGQLNAEALKAPPVDGEFWFIAWADVPPLSPYKIAMRLYAFDGKNFRTVWEPPVIISNGIDDAVQLTPDGRGFVVNQMPDWQSQIIVQRRYYLAASGPQEVSESTSERK